MEMAQESAVDEGGGDCADAAGDEEKTAAARPAITESCVMTTAGNVVDAARAQKRALGRKYKRSTKGKAVDARRYQTEAYRAWNRLRAKRRIVFNERYIGTAASVTEKRAISAYIKARRDEFKQGRRNADVS